MIGSNEYIELGFCQPQQRTILDTCPVCFRHCMHIEVRQFPLEQAWQIFVQ